ncbi:uncharacterized protein LOC109597403 isoform X2 [Aethina tumida]|uniref:uncharacterized protein LOC109597403 isoform X2 n=1 Tax=Aethina tumida TaxID=116153 RepID=UPI002148F595|nr:uncharacterized protein LOC109597403 isoform X2 [Aethina tumida]
MEIYSYLLCYLFISLVAIVSGQNQVCPKDLMFNEKISKCEECAKCYEDYKNKVDDLQNKARSIVDTIIDRYGSVDETAHNLYNNLLSAKTIKKYFTSNINEAINKINQLEKYKNTLKDPKINDLVQFLVISNSTMILRNYLEELFNKTSHFSLNAPNPFDILSLPINTEVELKYLQIKIIRKYSICENSGARGIQIQTRVK